MIQEPEVQLVLKEYEQIRTEHGFTKEYDRINNNNEQLLQAALHIIRPDLVEYPPNHDLTFAYKLRTKTKKQKLIIAAAFLLSQIALEIENEQG